MFIEVAISKKCIYITILLWLEGKKNPPGEKKSNFYKKALAELSYSRQSAVKCILNVF